MKPRLSALKRAGACMLSALAALSLLTTPAAAQGIIRDAEIEDTLRVYAEPLLREAGLDPDDVHLYLIEDSSLNAFVSGGQRMFFHTGLVLAADTPNELIGVMAHETGHIAGGHLARSRGAVDQAMGPMFISIALGVLALAAGAPQAGAALIGGSQAFAMGNFVRHTQVQESSADQAAAGYLEATGQSGRGLIDFFNHNLRQYEFAVRRMPPYLQSHPWSSDRVEALRQRVEAGSHYDAVDSEANVERFRFMQAKLIGFLRTRGQTLVAYPTTDTTQPARYARAVAYYRASELDAARAELDSLLAERPDNPYFQELMGQILFENGRAAEAIPFHRRSVELAPGEPLLQVNLARALIAAHAENGAAEAIPLLEQAVRREPDNAFAWRELAIARNLQGEEALAELASAEQNFAVGDYMTALSFAERARRSLDRGTPSYQRATDIVGFAGAELRERERRS